jgi:ABC-2 type transport system permease protein
MGLPAQSLFHNAVLGKELRTRMRNRHSMILVTLDMAILCIVAVFFLAQHNGLPINRSSSAGAQLFQSLAIVQLGLILLMTPACTASAISGERQRQTWDLLLVTRLSSFDIVWGKLVSSVAFSLLLILAPLPLFGSVFLFGGVAPHDVLHTYAVLLVTAVLLTMTSLFVSVLSRHSTVAVMVSSLVSLLLSLGPALAVLALDPSRQGIGLTDLAQLGRGLSGASPITPVVQVDPLVALLSVLPNGQDGTLIGDVGAVHPIFGLPLWEVFGLLTLAILILLTALCTLLIRPGTRPVPLVAGSRLPIRRRGASV